MYAPRHRGCGGGGLFALRSGVYMANTTFRSNSANENCETAGDAAQMHWVSPRAVLSSSTAPAFKALQGRRMQCGA